MSFDAKHFQVSTATNELQFYSVADGSRVASPTLMRDTKWATLTVPLGWNVQGCWKHGGGPARSDAWVNSEYLPRHFEASNSSTLVPSVVSVHRSPNMCHLAKGCVDGTVAVYNYPTHASGMACINV